MAPRAPRAPINIPPNGFKEWTSVLFIMGCVWSYVYWMKAFKLLTNIEIDTKGM